MFPILPPNEYRRREDISRLLQRAAHAVGVTTTAGGKCRRFLRAAGDVGLLRDRFRDHLGFLVSHDKAPFRGDLPHCGGIGPPIPQRVVFPPRKPFPRITDDCFCGERNRKWAIKKRTSPRMVQAGNANRRDNPYDRKIRLWGRILSRQMDYQYMEILAFSLVPISA